MGKFANSPREMHAAAIHAWEADGCQGPRPEFTSMEAALLLTNALGVDATKLRWALR